MLLAFTLTMPRRNTWNGRWTGDEKLYCAVRSFRGQKQEQHASEIIANSPYHYNFGDGWCARIDVRDVDSREAANLRRKSNGFCGYDWMVDTIIRYGKPLADHQIPADVEVS